MTCPLVDSSNSIESTSAVKTVIAEVAMWRSIRNRPASRRRATERGDDAGTVERAVELRMPWRLDRGDPSERGGGAQRGAHRLVRRFAPQPARGRAAADPGRRLRDGRRAWRPERGGGRAPPPPGRGRR